MKPRAIFLLSLGTGVLACTPSVDDYAVELEEAFCAWQHECHQYERVDDCIEAHAIDRDPEYAYLRTAVSEGRVAYDREAAAACLDAIRGRGCSYEDAPPEICDEVFRGRMGRNGPCMSTAECAGNAVCGFDPNCTDMCCVGACRVFPDPLAIGEPCTFSGTLCVPEAYCAFDPSTGLATVCTARAEVGESCAGTSPCVDRAVCDGSTCRERVLRGPGERCTEPFEGCEAPAVCRDIGDGAGPSCVVDPGIGAPCDYNLSCDRFDTFCDPESKLCTLLPGPGQPCVNGYQCLPYAECESDVDSGIGGEPSLGTCVALAAAGEPCGGFGEEIVRDCLGELECVEGRCELPLQDGNAGQCPGPG